jgi:predicted AAA+ superfamily ATPase
VVSHFLSADSAKRSAEWDETGKEETLSAVAHHWADSAKRSAESDDLDKEVLRLAAGLEASAKLLAGLDGTGKEVVLQARWDAPDRQEYSAVSRRSGE